MRNLLSIGSRPANLALTLWLTLAPASLALAQEPAPATDPSEDRSATFRAVDGAVAEDVPGGPLLVGAYGAALALLLGYVLWLGRLQATSTAELARLGAILEKSEKAKPTIATRDLPSSKAHGTKDAPSKAVPAESDASAEKEAAAKAE